MAGAARRNRGGPQGAPNGGPVGRPIIKAGTPENDVPPEDGSPYTAYPLSFPKVLAGLLYFDKKIPSLAATADQCEKMIPILKGMGAAWGSTHDMTEKLHKVLTKKQEAFVAKNKKEIEKMSSFAKATEVMRKHYPNEPGMGGLAGAAHLCTLRIRENTAPRGEDPATGDMILTQFDIGTGIILMEDHPDLKISTDQARRMLPMFQELDEHTKTVDLFFQQLTGLLTDEQIAAVGPNIKEITELKFATFKNPGGSFHDPLINTVLQYCEKMQ
ncbi:MAG: hypothetical protein M5R36_00085 [Deltaproteobacteria bacterium]|nr:hypothetical protein [Deltaproteobacteria bacterium]